MILYKKGFEKRHKQTIAVVYEVECTENHWGFLTIKKTAQKLNRMKGTYLLDPFKKYLIICGTSDWIVEGNKEICIYDKNNSEKVDTF